MAIKVGYPYAFISFSTLPKLNRQLLRKPYHITSNDIIKPFVNFLIGKWEWEFMRAREIPQMGKLRFIQMMSMCMVVFIFAQFEWIYIFFCNQCLKSNPETLRQKHKCPLWEIDWCFFAFAVSGQKGGLQLHDYLIKVEKSWKKFTQLPNKAWFAITVSVSGDWLVLKFRAKWLVLGRAMLNPTTNLQNTPRKC